VNHKIANREVIPRKSKIRCMISKYVNSTVNI